MKELDKTLCNIFNLMPTLAEVFFRDFKKNTIFSTLSKSHIKALMFIRMEGNTTMTQLSQKTELEKGSFTPVANHLIKLGYIKKIKSPEDKRITLLSLTEGGYDLTSIIKNEHMKYIEDKLDRLSTEEKAAFSSSIELVLSLANKMRD